MLPLQPQSKKKSAFSDTPKGNTMKFSFVFVLGLGFAALPSFIDAKSLKETPHRRVKKTKGTKKVSKKSKKSPPTTASPSSSTSTKSPTATPIGSPTVDPSNGPTSSLSGVGSIFPNDDFAYRGTLPPPPEILLALMIQLIPEVARHETPIQIWLTHRIDGVIWNCIAHYHPTALNYLTKEDPMPRVPDEHHTSEARALCMVHALNKLVPEILPSAAASFSAWVGEAGLKTTILENADAIELGRVQSDPSPHVIGSLVAAEMIQYIQDDGWNYKGTLKPNNETCTAHCRSFADSYGYSPKNSPWEITDPTAWQPLIESNDLGFYYAQEHVTPHIGFKAKPSVLTQEELNERKLDNPNYDFDEETAKVIDNVANLDDKKKALIGFFDDKLTIAASFLLRLRGAYRMSLEAQVFYLLGYTAAEYDACLLAWKEKVRFDRIRPTSVVQALGDVEVTSFAGTHAASDWVPYVRVMPHAEYPSGSGCICQALAQYIDAFLSDQYGKESMETSWDFGTINVQYSNLTEFANMCGESRLWGGMHFTAAVTNSYDLCDGVGTKAYSNLMKRLLGTGGSYDELMDADKPKYGGPIYAPANDVLV